MKANSLLYDSNGRLKRFNRRKSLPERSRILEEILKKNAEAEAARRAMCDKGEVWKVPTFGNRLQTEN